MNHSAISSRSVGSRACLSPHTTGKSPRHTTVRPNRRVTTSSSDGAVDQVISSNKVMGFVLAGAMLFGSATAPEALAAKSSGRAGGSAGFASRKAPPPAAPQAPSRAADTYVAPNVTNVYVAPPVYSPSPFGYSPFGGLPIIVPIPIPAPAPAPIFVPVPTPAPVQALPQDSTTTTTSTTTTVIAPNLR
mmetsp:Transcript_21163/g.29348  ORF Transcript_21163/g.29348 Transcript_21163/m.29348 type:complete len:189 (-) Transcript_21163:73-639(-)